MSKAVNFLHCNRCYKRNPPGGYLISSCFHILCAECTESTRTTCPICENDVKIVRLNGDIGSGIKMYFSDPIKTMTGQLEKIQKKMEFQTGIRSHLMKHLMKQREAKAKLEEQMRKFGPEFKKQKKELEMAKSWIVTAEQKLKQGEEEKMRIREEYQEMQRKFMQLHLPKPPPPPPANTPFSFMASADEMDLGKGSTLTESANSTFNFHLSSSRASPAPSCDSMGSQSWNKFFDNTAFSRAPPARVVTDDTLFAQMGRTEQAKSSAEEANAFSSTFNNMFTPSRSESNKTSASLENWKQQNTLDMSRRETSLPTNTSSSVVTPSSRRSSIPDRHQMREIRRCMGQPGFLAHRKSTGSRSSFLEPKLARKD